MCSNYKETVLKQLNTDNTEEVLKNLKEIQNKILKNLELQENKDVYNLLISEYTKIQKAGELIYAYKKLKANGNTNDTEMTLREAKKEIMQIDTYILKWETEQNACKKCRALDGNEYHIYDDIPPKPHPNCKCKVKILKQNQSESINSYKDIVQTMKNFPADIENEGGLLGYVTEQGLNLLDYLGNSTGRTTPKSKEYMDGAISFAEKFFSETGALWKFSSSKFTDGLEYLNENGVLLNSIDEFPDKKLKEFIHKKVKAQYNAVNSRGIVINEQSSLAEAIVKSGAVRRFIVQNKDKLKPNATLPDCTLEFSKFENFDLYNAIHYADIIDIKIDKEETFTAKIIDTYDFNPKEQNPLIKAAYHQQRNNRIEPYFIIIKIKISQKIWRTFL